MNLAEVTEQLSRVYASGRKFHFVEQAHRVLRQAPQAPQLAALTLRALVELGFGGPARELIQIRRDLTDGAEDLAELKAAIASLPNGRARWAQRQDVFARNVKALLRHRPHLSPLVDSLTEALASTQLYQTVKGDFQLSRPRQAGQLREWLPGLTDEGDGDSIKLPARGWLGAGVIIGVCVGPLIPRMYRDTHQVFLTHSLPLYLVESDVGRFAAWLHAADYSKLLDDERVYVLIGQSCVQDFRRLLTEELSLAIPTVRVSLYAEPSLAKQVEQTAESVLAERRAEISRLAGEIDARYRDRDPAYWARRTREPGCVLGVTSRYTTMLQYSTRDTLHALEELGYQPHMLIEEKDHYYTSQIETCRKILALDPDMLVFLDHLRYEYPHIPKNIPFLTWIQDPMDNLLCRKAGESIGPLDYVCGYFRDRCIRELGYPEDRFISVDVPVSTRLFHDGDLDAAAMAEYGCDISFVSNASTPIEQFRASAVPEYPASYRPMLEVLYRRAAGLDDQDKHLVPSHAAFDLVRSVAAELGIALDDSQVQFVAINFVYRVFDWGRRQETLEWVAGWARRTGRIFKIYGRGWDNHPTLSEFAAGVIEHGEPLRRAYRASRLALQLIPSGFRHQRSYELLAAGTLPLTRYCKVDFEDPKPTVVFPQLERIVFRTPEEFETLAERFLADEHYRVEVLTELREMILRDFTYAAVMRKVLNKWHTFLGEQVADSHAPSATEGRPAS